MPPVGIRIRLERLPDRTYTYAMWAADVARSTPGFERCTNFWFEVLAWGTSFNEVSE